MGPSRLQSLLAELFGLKSKVAIQIAFYDTRIFLWVFTLFKFPDTQGPGMLEISPLHRASVSLLKI